MYRGWAERRGMRHTVLDERHGNGAEPYRMVVAFSGYAAFALLEKEEGLHLFEIPEGRKRPARRMAARVRVIPQPLTPEAEGEALLRQALAELAAKEAVAPAVVRRYREAPSPLVRDNQRGWRTGKLDRVLAGDFDLMH